MIDLSSYELIIFDCDGVILNSNYLKTSAFYKTALFAGKDLATRFAKYHADNGGVSRYVKFNFFIEHFLNINPDSEKGQQLFAKLLQDYALRVKQAMMTCEMTTALESLKLKTISASWAVASGSDQDELRSIFRVRNLANYFDLGIFGSPTSKISIVRDLISGKLNLSKALIIGDSFLDYRVSVEMQTDFIYISGWSECSEIKKLSSNENIITYDSLTSLSHDLC